MRLPIHTIVALVLLSSASARAVDERDIGTYLLVNVRGEVTAKAMRLARSGNDYIVEDRRPDGSWHSVSCVSGCKMNPSSRADVERFLPSATLAQIDPSCIHSKAFAFCAYSLRSDANFRGYIFVALTEAQPISLRLARVVPDK